MKTKEQLKQEWDLLPFDAQKAILGSIEPDKKYFTDYTIGRDGEHIDKTDVLDGAHLSQYQMMDAILIDYP